MQRPDAESNLPTAHPSLRQGRDLTPRCGRGGGAPASEERCAPLKCESGSVVRALYMSCTADRGVRAFLPEDRASSHSMRCTLMYSFTMGMMYLTVSSIMVSSMWSTWASRQVHRTLSATVRDTSFRALRSPHTKWEGAPPTEHAPGPAGKACGQKGCWACATVSPWKGPMPNVCFVRRKP